MKFRVNDKCWDCGFVDSAGYAIGDKYLPNIKFSTLEDALKIRNNSYGLISDDYIVIVRITRVRGVTHIFTIKEAKRMLKISKL